MDGASSVLYAGEVDDRSVPGAVTIQVRVDTASNTKLLSRLERVRTGQTPAAGDGSHQIPAAVEERQIVEQRNCAPMPMIQTGVRPLALQILEIFDAARRENGAEYFSSCVVDQMAPGVGCRPLQTSRQAMGHLGRETIVGGVS